ncbi:carbonate dehydratase [Acidihalobacter yilgarnensis]|uniref:Carbonate dehydratase n=1 Tax=Acidihalobacter yilgarnensis TaxID=2819280 RepID=A0A1D8IRD7_9GAMM|nr:HAD-IC family P-type ATPase [Acidihalobacter yilgarnensis]AOU99050.1 carbonate dehydratase [Acidihalobacter yilgarnensis]
MPEHSDSVPAWHALLAEAIHERLDSPPGGLDPANADERLRQHGPNRLPAPAQRGPLRRFLAQFHNLLIYVLLAAGGITLLLRHWVDAGVILGVVVINALIGFLQEGRAEHAMAAIRAMLSPKATVMRGGVLHQVDAQALVPGDIVRLEAGDRVPADLRLLHTRNLRVDESNLTGESLPADKQVAPLAPDTPLADRRNMAYSGTLVVGGQATGVVIATAGDTELGRINALLADIEPLTTPLLLQIQGLARLLTLGILALATLTFAFGVWLHQQDMLDMFLAAVAFAVAAIPEGLPAIITITLAIGVRRMAERHVIIRRLPAVETLGAVSVICSDKTGTLTRNEMTVVSLLTASAYYWVEGVGYSPEGRIKTVDGSASTPNPGDLTELLRSGLLCNDGGIEQLNNQWSAVGDPIDAALVAVARKQGLDLAVETEAWPRIDAIPFDAGLQMMATLHHDRQAHLFIALKGAPERVLARCTSQRRDGVDEPIDPDYWQTHLESLADTGQRILALAVRTMPPSTDSLSHAALEGGFSLLGFAGFIDPPREEAAAAVAHAASAGVSVKMITGDHVRTAAAIAASLGISGARPPLTGSALDALNEAALAGIVRDTAVFARMAPEHKLRLIQALQQDGHVIAMTGDGVNDTPALKRADVGVAMGRKGTEAAKEAAEIVLTDDNFAGIVAGIEEGRTAYDNIRKSILFILPTNGAEALVIMSAVGTNALLPITAVQILWINMITAVTLSLALAFERPEAGVMRRPPRQPRTPLISPLLLWRIALVSVLLLAAVDLVFYGTLRLGADLDVARTAAVNMLVLGEMAYLLNARYLSASTISRDGLSGNPWVLLALALTAVIQLLFTYAPPMQALFSTQALPWYAWPPMIALALIVYLLVELEKHQIRRRGLDQGR